jgi:lipoprotein Spr
MTRQLNIAMVVFFSLAIAVCSAQDSLDQEQQYLSNCYYYSGVLGFNVDSITHPALYKCINGWLGVKYCYSGDTKKGIDCSGFATAVYHDAFGKSLDGSAADIYKEVKPLKRSQLKEGDLVFFKIRKKRVSHIGVYLSNNRFVHASVHEGVVVSDLDEPYYKKYFFKGGRVKG